MFLILALVLVLTLPSPGNLIGFGISLFLFLGELAFWQRRMRGQPKVVGAHKLIGMEGVVVTACSPEGQARVDGTLWTARCDPGAAVGERVSVVAIDGLTLIVRSKTEPHSPPTSPAGR